jgi:ribosome biogenesis protein
MLPTDLFEDSQRYELSRILNSESMLGTTRAVPFDFLINGTFLRESLEDYLKENDLSFETDVTLEYVRSLIPPILEASFEHDDWVSAIDLLSATSPAGRWSGNAFLQGQDRIVSASYDGLLRIWNPSNQCLATSPPGSQGGHTASIKSAKFVSAAQVVSTGMDRTVRIWKYTESDDRFSGDLKPTLELYGHKGSIDALAVDGVSKRLLTASTDGAIGLWSTSKSTSPAAPASLLPGAHASKRRKLSAVSLPQRGALSLMNLHTGPATAVSFDPRDRTVAYSAAHDHTLKTLDLTTAAAVSTVTASHALLSLAALPRGGGSPLLAAGTAARNVVVVDPREDTRRSAVLTLRGHANKVVSLAPSPDSEHALVSGSHDGTCRVWDLRRVRRAAGADGREETVGDFVYVVDRESSGGKKAPVAGEGVKVFGVAWDKAWGIVSCGEDKRVQVNRGRDILAE